MGDNRSLGMLVGLIAAVFAWWTTYNLLGGKLTFPIQEVTWGMRWRSFAGAIVALGFFWLAASWASRL